MVFSRRTRIRRIAGLAVTGYTLWQRLSPAQKRAVRTRAQALVQRVRGSGAASATPATSATHPAEPLPTAAAVAGAATAPTEEIAPTDLTSPGTIEDPELEQRRAEQALERERESRATDETKFEELRRDQEAERHDRAATIVEPPAPA